MGQAVVDLPDPIEKPPAGGNADDLLSQLAGDEIDRLLAEGDVDHAAEPAADAAAPVADGAAPVADAAMPVADGPATAADDATPAAELAKQVAEAKADVAAVAAPEPVAATPATPPASSEADQAIAAHAETVLGPPPAVEAPTPAEREDLLRPAPAENELDEDVRTPLLLRPLEWLSSPLDTLSPGARDFLGKAAIVTLVNSAAVIAYVIWFRK